MCTYIWFIDGVMGWIMDPKRYTQVLIPGICECDLIGKRIYRDIIKWRILWRDHPGLIGWALNSVTGVSGVRGGEIHREKVQTQRLKLWCYKSWNTWSHQKLEEARKRSLIMPSEEAQPCWCLDLNFWSLGLWENQFLLILLIIKSVVTCNGSLGKLIQMKRSCLFIMK